MDKDQEAKNTSLGSQRHINRVFDLMGVEYDDCPILVEQKDEAAKRAKGKKPTPSKEKKPTKAKGQGALSGNARLQSLVTCHFAASWRGLQRKARNLLLVAQTAIVVRLAQKGYLGVLALFPFCVKGFHCFNGFSF